MRYAAFLFLTLTVTACTAVPPDDVSTRSEPSIRGEITRVSDRSIVVEENPAEAAGSDKASVRITEATRIEDAQGRRLTAADLRVGQRVSAWFTGPVMESYPVQATGSRIVVERQPVR